MKQRLTTARVRAATVPEPKPGTARKTEIKISDIEAPGLVLRVYASGKKTWVFQYRLGKGRSAGYRRVTIGTVEAVALGDARRAAIRLRSEVAAGEDPSAAAREAAALKTLNDALALYASDLERRGVVRRSDCMSALRRGLADHLGEKLENITEANWKQAVYDVEETGKAGAAKYLRTRIVAFLGWAKERSLIEHHPLAGWRRPRATRAERLERAGRALSLSELAIAWQAASAGSDDFRDLLRLMMLTGQRRTETARMRWADLDLDAGTWTIPAHEAKNGAAHVVPLGPEAVKILRAQSKIYQLDWVFTGRTFKPFLGWFERLVPVQKVCAEQGVERWTLHDLRRSYRSGLSELGTPAHVSEAMLNHVGDELSQAYDRSSLTAQRRQAALRWESALMRAVGGASGAVIRFPA